MSTSLPSFLNYNRSISPSEGLMYGRVAGAKVPVEVLTRGVRGTISNYANVYVSDETLQSGENIAKQLDPKNANLQEIQVAFLPKGSDRLVLEFSLVVQANALAPSGCNLESFYGSSVRLASAYAALGGFRFLAERYLWNLINGRVLWRNRFAADKTTVISIDGGETYSFSSDGVSLQGFDPAIAELDGFRRLSAAIGDALSGTSDPLFLNVEISGRMPSGAEVFPSQEFLPEAKTSKDRGKVLSSIDVTFEGRSLRQATMHSQKIGNALRTIDEWHGKVDSFGTTAIEAYGTVQSRTDATRLPAAGSKGNDVFVFLKDIDAVADRFEVAKTIDDLVGDDHYLMAMLIRGGVFSGEKKEKAAPKAKKEK